MHLSPEQRATFNRAAHILSEASGMPPAAAVEKLEKEPGLLGVIATALRDMAGTSPLADEIDGMVPKPPPAPPKVEPVPVAPPAPAPKEDEAAK